MLHVLQGAQRELARQGRRQHTVLVLRRLLGEPPARPRRPGRRGGPPTGDRRSLRARRTYRSTNRTSDAIRATRWPGPLLLATPPVGALHDAAGTDDALRAARPGVPPGPAAGGVPRHRSGVVPDAGSPATAARRQHGPGVGSALFMQPLPQTRPEAAPRRRPRRRRRGRRREGREARLQALPRDERAEGDRPRVRVPVRFTTYHGDAEEHPEQVHTGFPPGRDRRRGLLREVRLLLPPHGCAQQNECRLRVRQLRGPVRHGAI
mmetsp:Transcript_71641/g.202253  ORF Transcript_71641/g.202253 Transcript_71641/m.202253 type:complete len:264 (+) Transcript_71641:246-1037(+)